MSSNPAFIEHGTGTVHVIGREADDRQGITLIVKNQGEIARTREGPHGLGLYIVDEIARAHGASVEMSSSNGETVFAIHWPRPREVMPAPAAVIEIQRGV
jgi:two-component sensor histidine kinase